VFDVFTFLFVINSTKTTIVREYVFLRFSKSKKRDFLRFCRVSYVFSNYKDHHVSQSVIGLFWLQSGIAERDEILQGMTLFSEELVRDVLYSHGCKHNHCEPSMNLLDFGVKGRRRPITHV